MNGKRWAVTVLAAFSAATILLVLLTVTIDPLFHYHGPLPGVSYVLDSEWYQNDGIVRNFSYDAVISGTSMSENFKTSQFDELFGTRSVKVPFSGGSFRDVNDCLRRAFQAKGDGIKYVVRSIDLYKIAMDKDERSYSEYPQYLYDDELLNDVHYVLNKHIFFPYTLKVLWRTLRGSNMTGFDEYTSWAWWVKFGQEAVIASEPRLEKKPTQPPLSEEERTMIRENLEQNVIALALEHPETEFYLFFPPYSVYYWDSVAQAGTLERQLEIDREAIELLLPVENIKLFSFADDFALVTDFDQYKDPRHYSDQVNELILRRMRSGEGQLTLEGYQDYCQRVQQFYCSYDYDSLYQ